MTNNPNMKNDQNQQRTPSQGQSSQGQSQQRTPDQTRSQQQPQARNEQNVNQSRSEYDKSGKKAS